MEPSSSDGGILPLDPSSLSLAVRFSCSVCSRSFDSSSELAEHQAKYDHALPESRSQRHGRGSFIPFAVAYVRDAEAAADSRAQVARAPAKRWREELAQHGAVLDYNERMKQQRRAEKMKRGRENEVRSTVCLPCFSLRLCKKKIII